MKCCCITGPRLVPLDKKDIVKQQLREEIVRAIEDGYVSFVSGFAAGTELYYTSIVAELKKEYPNIRLEAEIAYRPYLIHLYRKPPMRELLHACDWLTVYAEENSRAAQVCRNHSMIKKSGRLIAVDNGCRTGKTVSIIHLAKKMNREVRTIRI